MGRNPNRKKKISFQARRLVREVLSGKHKSISSAGAAAGYSGNSAHKALSRLQGTITEIMDQVGLDDAHLVENCLKPLLHATRTKHFQYKGKVKDSREEAALEIRRDALDIALRIRGKYAPLAVEQAHKSTVQVIVLDVPRPKRDHPPPTMIEIAKPAAALPGTNGNGRNGNGSSRGEIPKENHSNLELKE